MVFGKQSAVRQLIKGHAGENDEIKRLLVEGLGDLPMITDDPGQRVKCFVVSTQQTDRLEVRLIRSYKNPNKGRDQNERWAQWEAGMATSSAPTVFPPFIRTDATTGDTSTFIDGALSGYNNPSSLVLNEGLDLAEPGQRIDVLLSLGCGEAKGSMGDNPFWIVGQVMNLAFDTELQEAHVASMIRRFSPQTSHVRVNPPTAHYSLTEHRVDVLTRMEDDTRAYLAETRPIFAELASRLTAHVGVTRKVTRRAARITHSTTNAAPARTTWWPISRRWVSPAGIYRRFQPPRLEWWTRAWRRCGRGSTRASRRRQGRRAELMYLYDYMYDRSRLSTL